MKRIYVAGAYSADNVLDVLGNIRRGIAYCAGLVAEGHAPFCPWLDHQFCLCRDDLGVQQLRDYSMAWLEVCEEVHVLPNSEQSKGTQAEIARAEELGIPVRYVGTCSDVPTF